MAHPETKRAPMFHPRVPYRTLLPVLALVLLLAGCIMPSRQDATPILPPAEPPLADPVAEPTPEDLTAVVNRNANVRTGPGTDHAVAYWLTAGDAVTVTGRNADGSWLQIEHEDRPGWIFATLIDSAAEPMAKPATKAPPEAAAAEPTPEPEPAVEPVREPLPDPELQATPAPKWLMVTGGVVNLRTGPGTDYPTAGQVRRGDRLQLTGRNEETTWLSVMHPSAVGEVVWIFEKLTDFDASTMSPVAIVEIEVAVAPTPEPVTEPAAAGSAAAPPPDLSDCAQWHTVNPNETRLVQITDWYQLDLATVAALNGIDANAPLTSGANICLITTSQETQTQDGATEIAVTATPSDATPDPRVDTPSTKVDRMCITPWGNFHPCPHIPHHPERAVQSVPGVPVLYHAPGTYSRDLPGLDYDFELVLGDDSRMWNWRMRDPAACYDALRVHMAEIPEEIGLTRLEVRLSDPVLERVIDGVIDGLTEALVDMEFSIHYSYPFVEGGDGDNHRDSLYSHPDLGSSTLRCYDRPRGRPDDDVFCRIYPTWGNSGSIHLAAAVSLQLADTAGQMSRRAKAVQYHRQNFHKLQADAYVVPLIDDGSGDPVGFGPCMEVTRALFQSR
ncbi:MAG: SH3 domain-containing protein [Caldilineaceae bacterium]|nr:SH3 domain-containing protein [Caldilineaceae bacterium]